MNNRNVELFAIGNELLVGQVQDTNSHWLIRNLTTSGASVRRVMMLRDEYDEIEQALLNAVARRPRLIITTGGLGPTDDDLTARAISRVFDRPLAEDPIALDMVRKRYEYIATIRPNYSAELNEARRKMALMPRGATPLNNPNGAAPGIALDVNEHTTIVCLPGVPSEMKDIYSTSMQTVLERTVGAGGYAERTIVLNRGDESRIADLLQQVQADHPAVYVKSRGQKFEDGLHLTVVLSHGNHDVTLIQRTVHAAEEQTTTGLVSLGYTILRVLDS